MDWRRGGREGCATAPSSCYRQGQWMTTVYKRLCLSCQRHHQTRSSPPGIRRSCGRAPELLSSSSPPPLPSQAGLVPSQTAQVEISSHGAHHHWREEAAVDGSPASWGTRLVRLGQVDDTVDHSTRGHDAGNYRSGHCEGWAGCVTQYLMPTYAIQEGECV